MVKPKNNNKNIIEYMNERFKKVKVSFEIIVDEETVIDNLDIESRFSDSTIQNIKIKN